MNNSYSTESRTVGEIKYEVTKAPVVLHYIEGEGNINVNFLTYPEFIDQIKPKINNLKYINRLGSVISKYLNYLEVYPFELNFNIIVLPENYGLLHTSKKMPSKYFPIELTFVVTLPDEKHGLENLEWALIKLLPHELFHFLVKFKGLKKMNLLRDETFAHIFGECASFELNPLIQDSMILAFPDYFFKNLDDDFIKVRNKMKKDKHIKDMQFPKSFLGKGLARYYFQAVANNRTGENIHSDKIPKFCHKLFSEHSFKHPIEKKPPPWFKEFLETE